MINQPSITILFDPEARVSEKVFINGQTDQQTAKLMALADRMVAAIKESDDVPTE